jgi:hypothetical protein
MFLTPLIAKETERTVPSVDSVAALFPVLGTPDGEPSQLDGENELGVQIGGHSPDVSSAAGLQMGLVAD